MLLNPNASVPIYNQIAQLIKDQILDGSYRINEQVPSTNELSKLLQINPATARKGLALLTEENILYKKRGIGMFVCENAPELIKAQKSSHFQNDFLEKMIREAKKIGLTKKALIQMINKSELED